MPKISAISLFVFLFSSVLFSISNHASDQRPVEEASSPTVEPDVLGEEFSRTNPETGESVAVERFQGDLLRITKRDKCGRIVSRQPWQGKDRQSLEDFVSNLLVADDLITWPDDCEATVSLKKVVDDFNAWVDRELPLINQPPITESEVIAVLLSARSKYMNMQDHFNYDDRDFDLFETVAETKSLPAGSKFGVITGWEPRPYTISVWWVDLEMPNSRIRIRDKMIGVVAKRL